MVMPKEVKEALNNVSNDEDSERYIEVVKYIVAFAEAYGVYEPEILVETFNIHNEEKLSLEESFVYAIEKLSLRFKSESSGMKVR